MHACEHLLLRVTRLHKPLLIRLWGMHLVVLVTVHLEEGISKASPASYLFDAYTYTTACPLEVPINYE